MKKPIVILRLAPVYDPAAIEKMIREGLDELDLASRVKGRVTIKPNAVSESISYTILISASFFPG
jgi:hypothetical protein